MLPKSQSKPVSPEDIGLQLPPATIPVTVIMEGEFMGENLAQLEGVTKERLLAFIDRIGLKQKDVLVLLVSGTDVYVQPYSGEFITAQLDSDTSANPSISIVDEEESEQNNPPAIAPDTNLTDPPCDGLKQPESEVEE